LTDYFQNDQNLGEEKLQECPLLMRRANSLKKAVRQIIEQAEKTLDEQNGQRPPVVVVRPMSSSSSSPHNIFPPGSISTKGEKKLNFTYF